MLSLCGRARFLHARARYDARLLWANEAQRKRKGRNIVARERRITKEKTKVAGTKKKEQGKASDRMLKRIESSWCRKENKKYFCLGKKTVLKAEKHSSMRNY